MFTDLKSKPLLGFMAHQGLRGSALLLEESAISERVEPRAGPCGC